MFLGKTPAVHAMMDVSDGLLKDARRMAMESGLALRFECEHIPLRAERRWRMPSATERIMN